MSEQQELMQILDCLLRQAEQARSCGLVCRDRVLLSALRCHEGSFPTEGDGASARQVA